MIRLEQKSDPWNGGSSADEAVFVEQWLDAHPQFVQEYVTRRPTPAVLEYLLGTRALPASTILGQSNTSAAAGLTIAAQAVNTSSSVPASTILGQPNTSSVVAGPSTSRVGSGSNSPVRKISALQFEKRGQTLRRMVTTVDGVPSFLAAGGTPDCGSPSGSTTAASWRRRGDLKSSAVDSCELMNELIMDICNDLDVTSLSHKILQNVCLLLGADRCSLFLVERRRSWTPSDGGDERCLTSKLFDVNAYSTVSDCNSEEICVAWGSGIAGYVAMTGNVVNIPDAYQVCLYTISLSQGRLLAIKWLLPG